MTPEETKGKSAPEAAVIFTIWCFVALYLFGPGFRHLAAPPLTPVIYRLPVATIAWPGGICLLPIALLLAWFVPRRLPPPAPLWTPSGKALGLAVLVLFGLFLLRLQTPFASDSLALVLLIQATAAHVLLRTGAGSDAGMAETTRRIFPRSAAVFWRDLLTGLAAAVTLLSLLSLAFVVGQFIWPKEANGLVFSTPALLLRKDFLEYCFAILVIPACEEILFRAGLLGWLRPRLGGAAAVIVSALVFALLHSDPGLMWARGAAGLALGGLYLRTASLWPCLTLHALMNGAILVLPLVFGRPG